MPPADDAAAAQERLAELSAATWTLAAVGAAVEHGLPALLRGPADAAALARQTGLSEPLVARLAEGLVAAGLARRTGEAFVATAGLAAMAAGTAAEQLRADLRSTLLQAAALFDSATTGTLAAGWSYADERVLQAQGTVSSGAIEILETRLFPALDGIAERLDGGDGAFLDVGAGVAAVTIELCRRHPRLRAVGLEPQEAPAALARRNVEAARMGDRIEIRRQLVQDLTEEAAFDLAWLPGNFLPPDVLPVALAAVRRALRPGGYLLNATLGGGGDDAPSVAARLRAVLWGGDVLAPERAVAMLEEAGFVEVTVMPRLGSGLVPMHARRP